MTHVTNHAIRRYAERVLGIDFGIRDDGIAVANLGPFTRMEIEANIRTIVSRGEKARAPVVRYDGHRYVMKYVDEDGSVLTVTPRVVKKRLRSGRARRGDE
jgi:hypothetical protein